MQLAYGYQMKLGIVGTSGIAEAAHLPATKLVNEVGVTAVLSRSDERAKSFIEQQGLDANSYTDMDDFITSGIEAAIICSPDRLHHKQVLACLEANISVLCEKPLCTSLSEAEELELTASSTEAKLAVGFHLRHHQGHKQLRSLISQGKIGDVRHIRLIWAFKQDNDLNWRARRELGKWWSLAAVGSHCLDLARWFSDDFNDWKELSSVTNSNVWQGPHDEVACLVGELSNGITVDATSSVTFGPYSRLEIFGSNGMAVAEDSFGRHGGGRIEINNDLIEFQTEPPFVKQLTQFARFVQSGEDIGDLALISDGVRSVKDLLSASDVE